MDKAPFLRFFTGAGRVLAALFPRMLRPQENAAGRIRISSSVDHTGLRGASRRPAAPRGRTGRVPHRRTGLARRRSAHEALPPLDNYANTEAHCWSDSDLAGDAATCLSMRSASGADGRALRRVRTISRTARISCIQPYASSRSAPAAGGCARARSAHLALSLASASRDRLSSVAVQSDAPAAPVARKSVWSQPSSDTAQVTASLHGARNSERRARSPRS